MPATTAMTPTVAPAQPATTPARHRPDPAPPGRPARGRLLTAGALAGAILALSWLRYATFRSGTMDMAVFEQAVWKLAHFQSPEITTIGWNAFADHLSPVLALFVPFYWLATTPVWLFAAQALALGWGYLLLDPLFDTIDVPAGLRLPLRVAYVASPLLWNAALYDFHPTTLAVPFILIGLRAALTGNRRLLILSSVALVMLRDDLGLCVAVLALWGFSGSGAADRRFRLVLAGAGLAWAVLGSQIGSLLGSDRHWAFHYGYLAASPAAAAAHPLRTAVGLAEGVVRNGNGVLAVAWLLPLAFLPLLSPRRTALVLLPALPLLASAGPQFHSPEWHYGAPVFPFLIAGAAFGLRRVRNRDIPRVALVGVAAALVGAYLFGPLATQTLTRPTVDRSDARRALRLIRPGDTVVASDAFAPHLADRDVLVMYPYPFADPHPTFPLSRRATEVSAQRAAGIDVVVAVLDQDGQRRDSTQAFLASPALREFEVVGRFGDVVVYRRP